MEPENSYLLWRERRQDIVRLYADFCLGQCGNSRDLQHITLTVSAADNRFFPRSTCYVALGQAYTGKSDELFNYLFWLFVG